MSSDIVEWLRAEVVTCPGKGLDGNGMQHCAECCFGTGVVATTAAELRIMVLARDAADAIEARDAEIERLRAAGNLLAAALRVETVNGQMAVCDGTHEAFDAWQEARREW